jgi:putative transposase
MATSSRATDPDESWRKRSLPKLPRRAYQGLAVGHWIFSFEGRRTGWLNEGFLLQFQWVGLHACLRYATACPCFCLMPDHIHLLLMGFDSERSDQRLAIAFWRKQLRSVLENSGGYALQSQAYDHLLDAREAERGAFEQLTGYIRQNPWRAGLVADPADPWPFEGGVVPGYPDLNLRSADYWERYWKIFYQKLLKTV